ncbi:ABC transporter ATP-binding protein [Vallitaleaceae bacterium 9-2]
MRKKRTEDIILESFRQHRHKPSRILVGMFKGNYYRFALSGLFYMIKHSPAWVMPIVIANIVNAVMYTSEKPEQTIFLNALVISVLVLLNIPMNYLHIHFSSTAVRTVEGGLRSALINKLQQLSIRFHKNVQSGRIQSKVIRDVEAVQMLSSQIFVTLLNITINISIALVITALKNRVVFLFFLLTIPVASLTIVFFRKRIRQQNHLFRKEVETTSARVMDMQAMIPVTKAHGLEKLEMRRMKEIVEKVSEEGYRLDIIQANFGSVSWAIFQIFQIGALIFTGFMVLKGRIPGGDIVLYQSYFTTIVAQVSSLIMLLPTMAKGLESISSIEEVLNDDDTEDNSGKLIVEGVNGDFTFNDVHFKYQASQEHVLHGINLDIKAGETVAFVGESGAGKSTILNLLIGFELPTQGQLMVDGTPIDAINLRTYRKHIAVVPQQTILFSGSIRDNITYGMQSVSDEKVQWAIRAANLESLVRELPEGLDTKVGEHGNKLSGGQRQRIAIARALIRNPQVILFDEATSALDSVSESLIVEAMDQLIKGRTTFMVAHRLSTIRGADKICVLDHGHIVEIGSYEELMAKKGAFYHMKSMQS